MRLLKNKIIFMIVIFCLFVNVSKIFADTIGIHCPYCNNIGIRVLNDEKGVCYCDNCKRSMLILNGTIYTDDKQKLPLTGYIVYNDAEEEQRIRQIIASRNEALKDNIATISEIGNKSQKTPIFYLLLGFLIVFILIFYIRLGGKSGFLTKVKKKTFTMFQKNK